MSFLKHLYSFLQKFCFTCVFSKMFFLTSGIFTCGFPVLWTWIKSSASVVDCSCFYSKSTAQWKNISFNRNGCYWDCCWFVPHIESCWFVDAAQDMFLLHQEPLRLCKQINCSLSTRLITTNWLHPGSTTLLQPASYRLRVRRQRN